MFTDAIQWLKEPDLVTHSDGLILIYSDPKFHLNLILVITAGLHTSFNNSLRGNIMAETIQHLMK